MGFYKKFDPAQYDAMIALEIAAERAAERIRAQGWPELKWWPPFRSNSRGGSAFEADGVLIPNCQRFRWVDGSGPWLGEDGALYWMRRTNIFYRRNMYQMTMVYNEARITKVIEALDRLERQ